MDICRKIWVSHKYQRGHSYDASSTWPPKQDLNNDDRKGYANMREINLLQPQPYIKNCWLLENAESGQNDLGIASHLVIKWSALRSYSYR